MLVPPNLPPPVGPRRWSSTCWCLGAAVAALWLSGCGIEIGDKCFNNTDCSQSGDRLCLNEQAEGYPGGYCTLFNCQADSCPSEATCIAYRANLSDVAECRPATERSRLQRTFCMRRCGGDSDCRSGYVCLDLSAPDNPWGAEVLDDGASGKVCALPYEGPERTGAETAVCSGGGEVPDLPQTSSLDSGLPDAGWDAAEALGPDGGASPDAAGPLLDAETNTPEAGGH